MKQPQHTHLLATTVMAIAMLASVCASANTSNPTRPQNAAQPDEQPDEQPGTLASILLYTSPTTTWTTWTPATPAEKPAPAAPVVATRPTPPPPPAPPPKPAPQPAPNVATTNPTPPPPIGQHPRRPTPQDQQAYNTRPPAPAQHIVSAPIVATRPTPPTPAPAPCIAPASAPAPRIANANAIPPVGAARAVTPTRPPSLPLKNSLWQMTSVYNTPVRQPAPITTMTLDSSSNTLSGLSGNMRFRGRYETNEKKLTITNLVTAPQNNDPGSLEAALISALSQASSWNIADTTLYLLNNGNVVATFAYTMQQ